MPKALVDTRSITLGDAVHKYLSTKKKSTRKSYRSCLRRFVKFYDGTLEDFIKTVEKKRLENLDKPVIERERYAEDVVRDYITWLQEVGYSPNAINQALAALQNLMVYYNLQLSYRFIEKPAPRPLKKNRKHQWTLEEVREFIKKAEYVRDRAIMLCLFQSGMSISDLVALDYGDIKRELEEDKLPVLVNLYRNKTGVRYKTFFGRDAVKYLKLYLESRQPLQQEDPLFTKHGNDERVTVAAIQIMMKRTAEKTDFIDPEDIENGYNPARPHSLRAAFNSRLTGKMDRTMIEFFMGHAIGEEKRTYLSMPDNEFRELYMNHENLLAVERTSKDELSEKSKEISRKEYERLDDRFTELARENQELRDELKNTQGLYLELKETMDNLEKRWNAQTEKLRKETRAMLKLIDTEEKES